MKLYIQTCSVSFFNADFVRIQVLLWLA